MVSTQQVWINDDNDGLPNAEGDAIGTGTPDYEDGVIQTARDLEDFSRLYVHVGGFYEEIANGTFKIGLKWRDTNGTAPKVMVYKSTDTAGSDSYLKEDTAAFAQVSGEDAETLGEVAGSGELILDRKGLWSGYSEANPKLCLLFEGSGEGKGQLCITIHKADGTLIGEGPGVWLDLVNVRKMYQSSVDDVFDKPSDEAKESVVFVHGWQMSPEGSRNYAETMFKRMWHRGYKGRFAYFRWNTDWSNGFQWLPYSGQAIDSYLADYNGSEQKAWLAAGDLKAFVDNDVPYSSKNIMAHSMGNIVAGEALRQGMGITNYALMQAAVPSACYDEDETRIRRTETDIHYVKLFGIIPLVPITMWDNETPDGDSDTATRALAYRGRLAGGSVNAANLINFFLPSDYATFFAWEVNNDITKPPDGPLCGNYRYERSGLDGHKLFKFSSYDPYQHIYNGREDLSDAYEAMPFACRTWGKAVGAEQKADGSIDSKEDLSQPKYALQGEQLPGFGDEHSGQFGAHIQELKPFYDRLLQALDVGFNNE